MQLTNPPDPAILECGDPTPRQRELLQAWIDTGSSPRAADLVNSDQGTIGRARRAVQKRAEAAGWSPMFDGTSHVPSTEEVIGRSVYTKDDAGNRIWLKTKVKIAEEQAAFKSYINGLCSEIKPAKKVKKPTHKQDKDLMSAIFIGDAHVGMYAFSPETKHSNFDSDIASEQLRTAIDDLVSRAPNSETGMLVDVGDFMHMNSSLNKTLKGTDVDVDSRYSRVLEVAGDVMHYATERMLEKFKKVVVVIAKGNHNPDSAIAVEQIVRAYFRNEDRVTILKTQGDFHYIEWGKWLIGVNHGDKVKAQRLVAVMARDMAAAWGRTTHRMWAVGHFHFEKVWDLDGCTVHQFGALPPPDAWTASMGFGGDGQMQLITFRKEGGKHSSMIYDLPRPSIEPDVVIK